MYRRGVSILVVFLALSVGLHPTDAATVLTVHTHTGFGLLFRTLVRSPGQSVRGRPEAL